MLNDCSIGPCEAVEPPSDQELGGIYLLNSKKSWHLDRRRQKTMYILRQATLINIKILTYKKTFQ